MLDFILHLDVHLAQLIDQYQALAYLILALIIFCETGLVATPFLPGDSLLFAIGAVAAQTQSISLSLVIPLLFIAALLGDNVNYIIGRNVGTKLFEWRFCKKILKREYLQETHDFYERHGGKTIILARFLPIIRTFAPFVAGIGDMRYLRFLSFSVFGALFWISAMSLLGFYFGNLPFIKDHFELLILSIIALSVLPILIAFLRKTKKTTRGDFPSS